MNKPRSIAIARLGVFTHHVAGIEARRARRLDLDHEIRWAAELGTDPAA